MATSFNAWILNDANKYPRDNDPKLGQELLEYVDWGFDIDADYIKGVALFGRRKRLGKVIYPFISRVDWQDPFHVHESVALTEKLGIERIGYWSLHLWQNTPDAPTAYTSLCVPWPNNDLAWANSAEARAFMLDSFEAVKQRMPDISFIHLDHEKTVTIL